MKCKTQNCSNEAHDDFKYCRDCLVADPYEDCEPGDFDIDPDDEMETLRRAALDHRGRP